jgi:hypothetical protein
MVAFTLAESRLEGSACLVTTSAMKVANSLCHQLLYYTSQHFFFHQDLRDARLLPQLDKAILAVKTEAINSLSGVKNSSRIATAVLREYLLLGNELYSDTYPFIRLLLKQGADSNALGQHQFMETSRPPNLETSSQTMGSGTEWLLHRMIDGVVNPSISGASRGTLELAQGSFDLLHLMITSEDDLTRHSIVGQLLKTKWLYTKLNQFWDSDEHGHWIYSSYYLSGIGCVVYRVTLAHLLFPLLYLASGEARLPNTPHRALQILRNLYEKCSAEPIRLVGLLSDDEIEDDSDVHMGYQAYTIREIHPILPLTVTVGDFWEAALASEIPNGQGGAIDLSNPEASLRKALTDRELKVFEGHIDDFFAGETNLPEKLEWYVLVSTCFNEVLALVLIDPR